MSDLFRPTAHYFDGDRPVPLPVSTAVKDGTLHIVFEDGRRIDWPTDEVRVIADGAGRDTPVLRWTGDPLGRLCPKDTDLLASLPKLHRRAPPKGRGRLAAWAVAAIAAVALQIGVLVPRLADTLAGYIPPEGERALGDATFGHIRTALDESGLSPIDICEAPDGLAALDRLTAKLTEGQDYRQEISVAVLDHPMVNAFALPGGYVVLFRGLIDAANDPDEVAAVLGHEIGHVVSRDPTRHALRSAGSIGVLGLLFGDFAGGAAVLVLTEQLISASYSQQAETDADAFAHDLLEQAGISPAALGDMFETMLGEHGDAEGLESHFLSHPSLSNRINASRAAASEGQAYAPSMADDDWAALQDICG